MSKYIERVLLVFNPDGGLKGAAQYALTVDDAGVFPPQQGDAEALSPDALADVLGDGSNALAGFAQARGDVQRLQDALQFMQADIADRDARIAVLQGEIETLVADRDAAIASSLTAARQAEVSAQAVAIATADRDAAIAALKMQPQAAPAPEPEPAAVTAADPAPLPAMADVKI